MINHVTIYSNACPHPYVNESPWRTTEIHLGERPQPKQTRSFESQKRRRPPPPSASGLFPIPAETGLAQASGTRQAPIAPTPPAGRPSWSRGPTSRAATGSKGRTGRTTTTSTWSVFRTKSTNSHNNWPHPTKILKRTRVSQRGRGGQ